MIPPDLRPRRAQTIRDPTLKIENARFVVTVDPQRRIIQDGSILVPGPEIVQVGKAAELGGVAADRVVDARQMVVTPGFFNGHLHSSYAHAGVAATFLRRTAFATCPAP